VSGRGRAVAYASYLKKRHRVREGYHLAHYLSSHDEPMFLHELEGDLDRFRMCVALQMATLGIPVIYYGEEVARGGGVWPTNRRDMPWGERDIQPGKGVARDEALRRFYQRAIAVRRSLPALSRGDFTILSGRQDPLLVFARSYEGNTAIVAANRTDEVLEASYTVPSTVSSGALYERLTDAGSVPISDGTFKIQLAPRSVHVYTEYQQGENNKP
jgi:alpha-amylase